MTRVTREAAYWEAIAQVWQTKSLQDLWRMHSDAVNLILLERWLPAQAISSLLKTDLFDEAYGQGLYPWLATRAVNVFGIDISQKTVGAAQARYPRLRTEWADVRQLPFCDQSFEVIVSNSTLDHFDSQREIVASLAELHRVLQVGGQLILTLDNGANPLVAIRNALPFPWVNRLGLVPYYVGATYGPKELQQTIQQAGFEVSGLETVMHCPRVLAVAIAHRLEAATPQIQEHFLTWLLACEHLSRYPSRFLTGHFIAVRAVKRS